MWGGGLVVLLSDMGFGLGLGFWILGPLYEVLRHNGTSKEKGK